MGQPQSPVPRIATSLRETHARPPTEQPWYFPARRFCEMLDQPERAQSHWESLLE